MISKFKEYLTSREIAIESEEEGQLTFTNNDLNYLFVWDRTDSNYFRLILPNISLIQEEEKSKYFEIANDLTQRFKAAKFYVNSEGEQLTIWLSVDQFVYACDNIDQLFDRCVELLRIVIDFYRLEYQNAEQDIKSDD